MSGYYEGSVDDCESDVTWTMQEAVSETVESNLSGYNEVHQPEDPPGYHYMSDGKEKRKKRKRRDREKGKLHRTSQEVTRTEGVGVRKDPGYGVGLSRGFSLWRTLKDIRHCITKVSDPMTKAQRRSLRRKLTYYVDDMERIVVGVNPRAPEPNSEDPISGDEELREEVSALIEDALDEAALQGKIVQADYFETRMSYLEQSLGTLKEQLDGIASKKFVQEEITSKKVHEQDKQEANGTKERQMVEEDVRDEEKVPKRGQMQKWALLKKQFEEVASNKFMQEEVTSKQQKQNKQEVNGPKKRQLEDEDEKNDVKVQERGQLQKRAMLKKQLKEVGSKKSVQEGVASKKVQNKQEVYEPKKIRLEEKDARDDDKVQERGQMQKHAMLKEVASKKYVLKDVTRKKVQEKDKQEANLPKKLQVEEEDVKDKEKVLGRGQMQNHAIMLKKQVDEVASKKLVQAEVTSMKVQEQDKQEANGPNKRQLEEEERDEEKVLGRGKMQKQAMLKKQVEELASKKFVQAEMTSMDIQEQDRQEPNRLKKQQMEEEDVRHGDKVQERVQMLKQQDDVQRVSNRSPTVHTSLCSLQAAVISQHSNEGSVVSHNDEDVVKDRKRRSSMEEEYTSMEGKKDNEEQVEAESAKTLGQVEERSKEDDELTDQSRKIEDEVARRLSNSPFRGWRTVGRPRGRGRGRGRGRDSDSSPNFTGFFGGAH